MKYNNTYLTLGKRALIAGALIAASGTTYGTDYADPYWASPNANADFVDHFSSTALNRGAWKVESDIFVNGEDIDYQDVEYPQPDWTIATGQYDPGAVDDRVLILKARYMDGVVQDVYGGDPQNPGKPLYIRSGRIESQITDTTTFTYGKFEARLRNPPARNAEFPAWWLLGNFPDVGWTACQELDIMEFTGNNAASIPQTHWTAPYAVHGSYRADLAALGITDSSSEFVTYGVIKTPDKVEWYINGVLTKTFSRENQGDDQPWPYVTPMRMILNHAITHVEWPDVGNYNAYSTNPDMPTATGWSYVDANGVRQYEYIDTAAMNANIGRQGTDFVVDYVAHWPLPSSDAAHKYTEGNKYSFFRESGNTDGFYNLKGWLAPVAVTGDAWYQPGGQTDYRDNGPDNAADGYVGSKWATPNDDELHWVEIDYGSNKAVRYLWVEWSHNLPQSYDIYGKTDGGSWEYILTSDQDTVGWATHTFDINQSYRYFKLVTKGRIDKSQPNWLLEFKAFEDVANVYPKPASPLVVDRAVNVLANGDFAAGLSDWNTEAYDGADPSVSEVNGEAAITLSNDGANSGSVQLHTSGFGLNRDTQYEVSFWARAASPRDIQLRLAENTLNPSQAGTWLLETVTLGTSMTRYSFNLVFTAQDNPGRLAFLLGNMGTASVTIDDVVIREGAYVGSGEQLVGVIDPGSFVGASAGWETDWWGIASRAIDGSSATKASGNDGQSEGVDLNLTVRIDEHYEIREVWVAGDNSPDRSLDQFKVEYGTGNLLMDWTQSTTDGVFEVFDQLTNAPPVGERDFQFHFRPPAGQLVEVTDVQLMAIDHRPHRIYTLALDEGVGISPAGTLRYSRDNSDDAVYSFTAPEGKAINNVIVDGVSQGAITSFTFTNISSDHTIAVGIGDDSGDSGNGSTNLALGATASASSEVQPAAYAIDGNMSTRWESSHGVDPSSITVDLGGAHELDRVVIYWEAANAASYLVEGSNDLNNWSILSSESGGTFGNRMDEIAVSGSYRYLRINGTSRSAGNNWGYSIFELEVYGGDGSGGTGVESPIDISAAVPGASSELQAAANAIDQNGGTRWESIHSDNSAWYSLDLGSSQDLSRVEIDWEAANASDYQVQGSGDGVNWTTLATETGGTFGNRTDSVTISGSYRYLRINLLSRSEGNQWGYSIFELRLFGIQ